MSRKDMRKKITLTQTELDILVAAEIAKYSEFQTELYITAITLALHDLYGFGRERNLRALEWIFTLMDGMCEYPELLRESKKEVEEKFKISTRREG